MISGLSTTTGVNNCSVITATTQKLGFISIVANINDKLNFTDSTGAACNFTIPASPLYSSSALVNALNVLFSTALAGANCNIVASFNTTTNLFSFENTTTATYYIYIFNTKFNMFDNIRNDSV